MSNFELRPLEGITLINGVPRKVRQKDFQILLFKGRQIATPNMRPGAAISLLGGVALSVAEKKELSEFMAKARGGTAPASVDEQVDLPYEIIDDEESEVTPKKHKK